MVQAELKGRKTMTRRLKGLELINMAPDKWNLIEVDSPFRPADIFWFEGQGERVAIKCPYGQPGDLLWVRESFRVNSWVPDDGEVSFRYEADGAVSPFIGFDDDDAEIFNNYWVQSCDDLLKAGYQSNDEERFEDYSYKSLRLRPNIFLRKEAARIWLQKSATKVERVCDISREDAIAEGLACISKDGGRTYKYGIPDSDGLPGTDDYGWPWSEWDSDPVQAFKKLWCKINGADTWNDWAWVNSFKVLSTTGKPSTLTEKMKG